MSISKKIRRRRQIIKIAEKLRSQNKKIITFNGCLDLLHVGHIRALEEAKRHGDSLIVLINSDSSVRKIKGPGRPINSEKDRAEMLAAFASVDYVSIFNETDPRNILSKIKPHIHVKSKDWGLNCIEGREVEKHGGKIHVAKWTPGKSTTRTIEKIIKRYG